MKRQRYKIVPVAEDAHESARAPWRYLAKEAISHVEHALAFSCETNKRSERQMRREWLRGAMNLLERSREELGGKKGTRTVYDDDVRTHARVPVGSLL